MNVKYISHSNINNMICVKLILDKQYGFGSIQNLFRRKGYKYILIDRISTDKLKITVDDQYMFLFEVGYINYDEGKDLEALIDTIIKIV